MAERCNVVSPALKWKCARRKGHAGPHMSIAGGKWEREAVAAQGAKP